MRSKRTGHEDGDGTAGQYIPIIPLCYPSSRQLRQRGVCRARVWRHWRLGRRGRSHGVRRATDSATAGQRKTARPGGGRGESKERDSTKKQARNFAASAYMEEVNGKGMERVEVWVSGPCVDTGWRRQAVWRCALCHLCWSIRIALSAVSDTRATRKRAWTYTDSREPPIGTHLAQEGSKLPGFHYLTAA
jgi:ribosomal protein S11